MVRPPSPDQPSADETAELAAQLRDTVQAAHRRREQVRRREGAPMVRGPDLRGVYLCPQGTSTRLVLVEHGEETAERLVDTRELIELLSSEGQSFAVLHRLVGVSTRSGPGRTA